VQGDWHAIGQRDGKLGHDISRFQKHKEACAQYDKTTNLAAYKSGRAQGLKSYCQIQRQLDLGLGGIRYKPVCSGSIVPLLKEANEWGQRGSEVKYSLSQTNNQLEAVREKIRDKKVEGDEQDRLEREEQRLLDEIDRLRLELVRMKAEAERTLSKKAKTYYAKS